MFQEELKNDDRKKDNNCSYHSVVKCAYKKTLSWNFRDILHRNFCHSNTMGLNITWKTQLKRNLKSFSINHNPVTQNNIRTLILGLFSFCLNVKGKCDSTCRLHYPNMALSYCQLFLVSVSELSCHVHLILMRCAYK